MQDATGNNVVAGGTEHVDNRFAKKFEAHLKGKIKDGVLTDARVFAKKEGLTWIDAAGQSHTGKGRLGTLPDLPAIAETVPGFENGFWFGFLAPKGTPADRVAWLNREINASLNTPLGPDKLVLAGFEGSEGMSQLFEFRIEAVSKDPEIDFDKALQINIKESNFGAHAKCHCCCRYSNTSTA